MKKQTTRTGILIIAMTLLLSGCNIETEPKGGEIETNNRETTIESKTKETDSQDMLMQMFIEEAQNNIKLIGKGRIKENKLYERTDDIGTYKIYTKLTHHYPKQPERIKIYVEIYNSEGKPITMERLASNNKRGNIVIQNKSYTPYIHGGHFFETEFKTTNHRTSKFIMMEFMHNQKVISHQIPIPTEISKI